MTQILYPIDLPYVWKRQEKTMAANLQRDDLHGIPMTKEAFEQLISLELPVGSIYEGVL
jgi:hypothetical protein